MATFSLVTSSAAGAFSSSMDGRTWAAALGFPGGTGSILCVQWSPGLGLFTCLGSGGAGSNCFTSPDAVTWTAQAGPSTVDHYNQIAWSPSQSIFCAIAANTTSLNVATSSDGKNWTVLANMPSNSKWRSICWSPALAIFVAVGNNVVATSPDGVTWTAQTIAAGTWANVIWSPALAIFLATLNGTTYATSTNGTTWSTSTLPSSPSPVAGSGVWSASLGIFCLMVGASSNALTSPDGVTWTSHALPATMVFVQRSEALGLFVAINNVGAAASSPDGVTWTSQTVPNQIWAQPAINDSPSIIPSWPTWRVTEEPGWVGKSGNVALALLSTLIVTKPFFNALLGAYRYEEIYWLGQPDASATIALLTHQKIFGAGGQVPTKSWHYDYDGSTYWLGEPDASAIIPLLTQQKFFGAGGQAPTKAWRYDYETLPQWQGVSTSARTLRNLAFMPTSPTKQWRYDLDNSTALFQFFYQSNFPLLALTPQTPAVPKLWYYNYEIDQALWLGKPRGAFISALPITGVFSGQRRYDYVVEPVWQGQSIASNIPTEFEIPFSTRRWNYNYAVEAVWQGQPLASNIPTEFETPFFTRRWNYNYELDVPVWGWRPPSYSLLYPVGNIGKATQRVLRYDYSAESEIWYGRPVSVPIKPTTSTPATARQSRFDGDTDRAWQRPSVANALLYPQPNVAKPFPSLAWHYDYLIEAPLWLGQPIHMPTPFVTGSLRVDPRFISLAKTLPVTLAPLRLRITWTTRTQVTVSRNFMPQGNDFSPMDTTETVTGTFDFGPWLPPGTTINSVASVICAVHYGSDTTPATRLIGGPTIVASPWTGGVASAVLQQWGTMLADVTYIIECTINTSDGQQLTLWAYQACQQPS